mmetsp:Transcript_45756/g.68064  ORF Transcript_45756/g.68064 Transcript_45756/m.68064 type:complete len:201 (-) Transcript_45756:803-1405(-)
MTTCTRRSRSWKQELLNVRRSLLRHKISSRSSSRRRSYPKSSFWLFLLRSPPRSLSVPRLTFRRNCFFVRRIIVLVSSSICRKTRRKRDSSSDLLLFLLRNSNKNLSPSPALSLPNESYAIQHINALLIQTRGSSFSTKFCFLSLGRHPVCQLNVLLVSDWNLGVPWGSQCEAVREDREIERESYTTSLLLLPWNIAQPY